MEIGRCGVDTSLPIQKKETTSKNSPLKIGSLGRLVEKKGIDVLINAGIILKEKNVNFIIEIAGGGPLQPELEKQVTENGLQNNVRFLGAVPHAEVLNWMQTLAVFVLAAKKDRNGDMDGIPVVLMEAMNLGIPVLSTYISGIPELIQNRKNGLMCNPGDIESLAENLMYLYNNPGEKSELIYNAKKSIKEEFDQDLNARRLIRIFNE